jgi:hypothetical protein
MSCVARELARFFAETNAPPPRTSLWSYVSVGAIDLQPPSEERLEFLLCTPEQSDRAVELVTMAAWYHAKEGLGLGHTLPIGEPWLPGATCDCLLVSLPYPHGPELERLPLEGGEGQVLWLLPITAAEREYKVTHGIEALEQLFDANELEYWDCDRPSVVFDGTE